MTSKSYPPNWRELCAELLGALENEGHAHWPGGPDGHPLIEQARAALAEPDGPTLQLPEQAPDEHPPSNLDRREVAAWYHGHACGWQAARAAIARWSRQPAPPAEGEVAELVSLLRNGVIDKR